MLATWVSPLGRYQHVGSFPTQASNSPTPVGCPMTRFKSDTIYVQIPQVEGSVSRDRPTSDTSQKSRVSPVLLTDRL